MRNVFRFGGLWLGMVSLVLCLGSGASAQTRIWFQDGGAIALQSGAVHTLDFSPLGGLNGEAAALFQSFPVFENSFGSGWTPPSQGVQPGTIAFDGGGVCTRYVNGRAVILPGCRGPDGGGPTPGIPEPTAALFFAAGAALVARRMRALKS